MARSKDSTIANSDFKISFIDEIKGKGLFATRNYLEGEIIFEEEPLVSCQFLWNKAYGYLACDFCMRPLENPEENVRRLTQNYELSLPYPELYENVVSRVQCSLCGVSYCCESCKEKAWDQNHEILCLRSLTPDPNHPLVLLQETWKQMHFPPETASIMLLTHIIALVRQSQEKDGILKRIMEFCHHTTNEEENIAHKLLGEEFRNQLEKLRTLWLTPDGFRSLFALVGTNGQGIGTSPFSVWVSKCENLKNISEDEKKSLDIFIDDLYEKLDEAVGGFLNSEGSGLYCLQSCCNHSCAPNASVTFPHNNFRLVLKATSDINEGDEICISYLDECDLGRSRHSRQKILR
ncbi:SET and MYND domain-containing protein 5 [Armadillidium vulgare]|nr:SET and MYND domain-containing protein 5 [Armadillidium vulgare]